MRGKRAAELCDDAGDGELQQRRVAPAPAPRPQRAENSVCEPLGECARRLTLLLAADWVRLDDEARAAVSTIAGRAAKGECLDFCRTQYCCRIHWCPARRREGAAPAAGGSRYECDSGPHVQRTARKGRHQVDFPFFCGDVACCNGQWFCRDETHKRKEKRRVGAALCQDKVVVLSSESATRVVVPQGGSTLSASLDASSQSFKAQHGEHTSLVASAPEAPISLPPPLLQPIIGPTLAQLDTEKERGPCAPGARPQDPLATWWYNWGHPLAPGPQYFVAHDHFASFPGAQTRRRALSCSTASSLSLSGIVAAKPDWALSPADDDLPSSSSASITSAWGAVEHVFRVLTTGSVKMRRWVVTMLVILPIVTMGTLLAIVSFHLLSTQNDDA